MEVRDGSKDHWGGTRWVREPSGMSGTGWEVRDVLWTLGWFGTSRGTIEEVWDGSRDP